MSRCTSPWAWAAASPAAICVPMRRISWQRQRAFAVEPLLQRCAARRTASPGTAALRRSTRREWRPRWGARRPRPPSPRGRTACGRRRWRPGAGASTLIATVRSSDLSMALSTTPMPPRRRRPKLRSRRAAPASAGSSVGRERIEYVLNLERLPRGLLARTRCDTRRSLDESNCRRLEQLFRFSPGFRLGGLLLQRAAAVLARVQVQRELALLRTRSSRRSRTFESRWVAGVLLAGSHFMIQTAPALGPLREAAA